MTGTVVTHVGLCVTDLERAERFYVEGLGFTRLRELSPPDGVTAKLLRIARPVGLTAVYLGLGDFVLELLHFDRPAEQQRGERTVTEPGLTHLSISVADVAATAQRLADHGGMVLADTDVQVAVLVRDPDGQILELVAARA
jgi:lactoylglutathione lyase